MPLVNENKNKLILVDMCVCVPTFRDAGKVWLTVHRILRLPIVQILCGAIQKVFFGFEYKYIPPES